jgi:hypothetical protein
VVRPGGVEHVGDGQLSFFVGCLNSGHQWDSVDLVQGFKCMQEMCLGRPIREVFLENCIINRMRQSGQD